MHGHLVSVEVRIERVTHERMELDRVALDEPRTEGLDALAVQGRRAVEEHVFALDSFFEELPHFCYAVFDNAARAADVEREFAAQEGGDNELAEEFERHVLRPAG